MKGRVLVVDDDGAMRDYLVAALTKRGYDVTSAASGDAALERLAESGQDVVVTDLEMSGMHGLALCERIVSGYPDLSVIVLTAFGSLERAVAAIRVGAYDFLTKPVHLDALAIALARAVEHRRLREEVKRLRRTSEAWLGFGDLVGESTAMRAVYDLLSRIADSNATVLITGESGTGKEVVARSLHRHGPRQAGPFVAVNCAAMPETLLESELFGHAKGAFTDARSARTGLFVQAHSGTLFLDEIGELPVALQAKLLRALQERVVRPVGGNSEVSFDAHIVAATNRDLETAIEDGRFRQDLYFRINVIQVELPPLRARGADVLLLADTFLRAFAAQAHKAIRGLSTDASEKLLSYAWPGNVRELSNAMERAVALARFEEIQLDDLPDRVKLYRPSQVLIVADDPAEFVPLEEVERRYVLRVFEAVQRNRSRAARILGVDRKTLRRKLIASGAISPDEGAEEPPEL